MCNTASVLQYEVPIDYPEADQVAGPHVTEQPI